ncbi:hypothetical protein Pint_36301 [Pistacia integerrima]|uniref:Uncharacterized protein n=1 Tax=Pistacia integerrima TaxID=434235 RepID=A0ACC0Y2A1_9ROSI|nr:hypothetical protein Pint_36301 [Pistacia integerrima]
MKLVRFSAIVHSIKSHLGLGNVPALSSYSTNIEERSSRISRWKGSMNALYRRISPIGDPSVSIVPLLDQWIEEGHPVDKEQLQAFIKELRFYRRFSHGLEISMWMTDKRYLPLTSSDVAIRLDLISKVHGTEQAENYFNHVSERLKGGAVYSALLNCYASVKSMEKAEATMQKMRDLGFAQTSLAYNVLLNLYYQTANYDKLDSLMHEMQEKGVGHDKFTMGIRLSAFGATSDVEGIDKTLAMMESDPSFVWDWTVYSNAASGYAKAGLLDKAVEMLKKSDELITGKKSNKAYESLISQYAKFGKKDDVLRLWELYKKNHKIYNKGYICVISSLLKSDDIESAKKIFDEWESVNEFYDIRILNCLIGAYSRKGLFQEAENLIDGAKLKGGKPNQTTWIHMAIGYFQHNETQKAVVAMEEALVICKIGWKPREVNFSACLKYYIGEGDIEGAEKFIKLLGSKDIISVELQDRLLNYVQNGKSNMDELTEYAKLPLIPTFLPFYKDQFIYGVNFASSGAGALAETQRGYVIDLNTQLSYFKLVEKQLKQKLGDAGAKRLLSKAVYIFSIGTNDYLVPLFTNSSVLQSDYSRKKYIGMVIGNLTTTIKEIYEIGGRKFGFLNLDDLGCLPLIRAIVPGSSGSCLESVSELAKLNNKALSEVLPELESQLPGFKYAIHDFYNSSLEIINNPSRYGLKEAIVACCGSGRYRGTYSCGGMTGIKDYELCDNPEEYMFFDAIHPTEKTYKIIAELVWNGTPNITGPYNLKKLFEHL